MILSGKQDILILVKTYPTPSKKYDELVCTAGMTRNGQWIRLYPIEYRKLPFEQQYQKYDWIRVTVERRMEDFRSESYRPLGVPETLGNIPTDHNWKERKEWVFKLPQYTNMTELIAKSKEEDHTSLALFKPTEVLDFYWEEQEREWNKDETAQLDLFQETFHRVKKIPYKFKYHFLDAAGRESNLMIEDWELGRLFWRYVDRGEHVACQKVKEKFFDEFVQKKDLYFFLGTTKKYHNCSKNPFIIVGVFYPPLSHEPKQLQLFG